MKYFMSIMLGLFLAASPILADELDSQVTDKRSEPLQLLFIHHSCGGHLMADPGPREGGGEGSGSRCIYVSHPYGGGLRSKLEEAGFQVNEASYGSIVGEDTDIHHWHAKFRDQMARILKTKHQDDLLPEGETNRVVAFKSCYPNNKFIGEGKEPGNPDAPELTVANAKAAYLSLLPYFEKHPEVLFVAFTAPPMAEPKPVGWKAKLKSLFEGKPKEADLAPKYNTWLVDRKGGWLGNYSGENVVVFDHYDVLTKHGETNWSAYPTQDGRDSHPSSEGNQAAAEEFVPFIQKSLAEQN